jgi:polysaccharide export outer membrane protein
MKDLKRLSLLRVTFFALAFTCFLVQKPAAAGPQPSDAVKVTKYASVAQGGSGANIRSRASMSSDVLRSVPPGYPVVILERQGDWFMVEDYRARKGWVFASLLAEPVTVIIKVQKGNLRGGPGIYDAVVAQLNEGTVLSVVEIRGEWLQVNGPGGIDGWVHRDVIWPADAMAVSAPKGELPGRPAAQPPGKPEEKGTTVAPPVPPEVIKAIQAESAKKEAAEASAPAKAKPASPPAAVQEHEYRLGPRDVVTVNIFAGGEKQISEDATVSTDGQITLPLLGGVKAAGMTLGELRKDSIEPLALDYFVEPQVTVAIKEYHSLTFYISGSIKNPGHYELDKEPTILELIAKAGGLEQDYGHKAYIIRETYGKAGTDPAKPIVVDLKALLDQADMTTNIRLATGDVIHIPRGSELNQASNAIFVEGEVKKPGVYTFQQGITALSACILAGGFNDYAAPNRARIIRRSGPEQEVIELNLDAVKKGKANDVELKPGDLVHIPDSWL